MRDYLGWLFGLLVLAAVVALVLNQSELEVFAALIRRSEPLWLIGAVLLQLTTYLWLSLSWNTILERTPTPLPLRQLLPLSVAKLFVDQAAPSAGISGNLLLVESLRTKGVSRPLALAVLALSIIGDFSAYVIVALAALLLLWLRHAATMLLATGITIFLCIAFAILGATFLLVLNGGRLPRALMGFKWPQRAAELLSDVPVAMLKDRQLLLRIVSYWGLIFLSDAATLWVALPAVGFPAPFATAFIAYILAAIAVTLGPIPMGLGSFEAVCIGVMHALGVPLEAAAAATLIFRGLALWLPLAPGLLLARRLLPRERTAEPRPLSR